MTQVVTCDLFEIDVNGHVICNTNPATVDLVGLQNASANGGLTTDGANQLLGATAGLLAIAFIFALVIRQLK